MEKQTDKELYIESLQEQTDQLHDLKALGDTPGGKVLIDLYMKDAVGVVYQLANKHKDMNELELKARCIELNTFLYAAKMLINAEDAEKEVQATLEEALRE